jgi:hypothetical protein
MKDMRKRECKRMGVKKERQINREKKRKTDKQRKKKER